MLGVVQVPATGKVYWAAKGHGAWVKDGPSGESQSQQTPKPKRLQAARYDPSAPGLTIVGSSSHRSSETDEFLAQFKDPTFRQLGSSLKLLMVAEGEAHIYPRLAPTCEWDTAAAHVIVTEAGGSVIQAGKCDSKGHPLENWRTVLEKDEPVVYNKEDPLNPYFVVYGARG